MRHTSAAALFGGIGLLASVASGQSINIRFGSAATTPSAGYAAAGVAGVWNTFQVPPAYQTLPLVSLQGTAIAAQFYQSGSSNILTYDNPLTSGDDQNLMDSMCLSTNNSSDGCFWVQNLMPGDYEVTIYAMTPNDPTLMSRTRVDSGTPVEIYVGGTWPGHHQLDVTYSRFTVTTTGTIGFHDGLAGAVIQSGMNGAQLRFLGTCATASFTGQPASITTCSSGHGTFSVAATSGTALGYQWQLQTSPGVWTALTTSPLPLPCGGSVTATAPATNQTNISITPCPGVFSYQVRCLVSNACGSVPSNPATYSICYANCDCSAASPVLNVTDFTCFLQKFGTGDPYANCDGSTTQPVLNVTDFTCFLQKFAQGCP
jgi:hypothetical protein